MFNRYSMLKSYISKYLGRNIFRDNEVKTFGFSSKFFNPIWNCFIRVDPTQRPVKSKLMFEIKGIISKPSVSSMKGTLYTNHEFTIFHHYPFVICFVSLIH